MLTHRLPTRHLRRRSLAAVYLVAVVLGAAAARAQEGGNTHTHPPPVARAVRRVGLVVIDGRLDDAAWAAATPISEFRQQQPTEGALASQRTELRVLFDDDALYVGARMFDSLGARGIRAPLARRDQLLAGNGNNGSFNSLTTDRLAVVFDPYHNHQERVWFEINPAGVRGEEYDGDQSYDPIWEAAAHVDSLGWTAEMRIPLSQLRFSRDSLQTWGMQVWRSVDRLHEQDMWSFWKLNEPGGPAQFGHLTGLVIGHRPRQLEIVPYAVSRAKFERAAPADPFHRSSELLARVGGDVKYLLTSNLTLDATVNPDFGQVEVDPAVVNLSAFETFYDEKRPFFVAGGNAYSYGGFNCMFCDNVSSLDLFYSRRIGRVPQLNGTVASAASYANLPENTTILGAAKITGRTAGGTTVGLLDAVTNRATAPFDLPGIGGGGRRQEVEPLSNYFVGRLKHDLRQGATTVGGIVTSAERSLGDSLLALRLRRSALAGGVDVIHLWDHQNYSFMGQFAASSVAGSDSAIASTERSSAHYFQRPDRRTTSDGLFSSRYDVSANSLRGYGLYARLAKEGGNFNWETAQNWRSPGFEVNDLSYLRRADYKWMLGNVAYNWTIPTAVYRSMNVVGGAQQEFNYDGDRTDAEVHGGVFSRLGNYWQVRMIGIHHPTTLSDVLTRGGPVVMRTGYNFTSVGFNTDTRRTAVIGLQASRSTGIDAAAHRLAFVPSLVLKPSSNVYLSFSPSWESDQDAQGYVTAVPDPTNTAFYGERYVFAFLRQRTLSFDTRLNVTFTPGLTFELFAQPFFASGHYTSFREFAATRSVRKLDYGRDFGTIAYTPATDSTGAYYTVGPDGRGGPASAFTFGDPDFSFRSLRGNAVLRWEYRPGSTLFFVWTQQRTGSDAQGNFDFGREREALFRDRPTNIFLVKVNYWVGR